MTKDIRSTNFDNIPDMVKSHDASLAAITNVVIPLEMYRNNGNDDTTTLNNAIAAANHGDTIRFQKEKTYVLQSIPTITKSITLDFNGAIIQANTTGILFTLGWGGDGLPPIKLLNGWFQAYNSVTPTDIIQINGAINPVINCTFASVNVSHAIIWNNQGYGLRGKAIIHWCNAPKAVLFSCSTGDATYSYDINFDVDISNHTGLGVYIEGGDFTINGVIESCSQGGLKYGGEWNIAKLTINAYFESNQQFDIQLNSGASTTARCVTVNSKFIGSTTYNKIMLGQAVQVVALNCFYQYGGVIDIGGAGTGASTYLGINNTVSQTTTGWTNAYEVADTIKNTLIHNIIKPFQAPAFPTISVASGSPVTGTLTNSSQTLIYKSIDEATFYLQYTFVPGQTGQAQFAISPPSGYAIKSVEIHFGTIGVNGVFNAVTRRTATIYGTVSSASMSHDLWVTVTLVKQWW